MEQYETIQLRNQRPNLSKNNLQKAIMLDMNQLQAPDLDQAHAEFGWIKHV